MTLKSLIKISHDLAKSKGFWDGWIPKTEKLALIISELGEALESHRSGKFADLSKFIEMMDVQIDPDSGKDMTTALWFERYVKDSFEDELADVFIRMLDYIGGYNGIQHMENFMLYDNPEYPLLNMTVRDLVDMHKNVVDNGEQIEEIKIEKEINVPTKIFYICRYVTDISSENVPSEIPISYVITSVCELAFLLDIDLMSHIKYKLNYNSTRKPKHGKKY